MIPDYYGRLACLCFASFFLVHTAVGGTVLLLAPAAFRRAERLEARAAARFLFSLRLLPFVVAACVVMGLCVPSYLWLEPRGQAEPLGMVCAGAAALAVWWGVLAMRRAIAAMVRSINFGRNCREAISEVRLDGRAGTALIVDARTPLLAVSGVFRPKLFLSRGVFQALSPDELGAALRHEDAHKNSQDNLKRLAFLLVPEILPFMHSFAALERSWGRYSEWAADDEAVAGDLRRALSLASALVRVARMGTAGQPDLTASLTACGSGLEARIVRLLQVDLPAREIHRRGAVARHGELLLAGATAAALVLLPGALACVHGLLERLVR